MRISVTEAKAHLTDLVRRAEAGEEIVLTRHGQAVARLSAANPPKLLSESGAWDDFFAAKGIDLPPRTQPPIQDRDAF